MKAAALTATIAFIAAAVLVSCACGVDGDSSELRTVLIVLLARNKAHTLPHFLAMLDGLDYPRDKLRLWIRSDHNRDATPALLRTWLADVADEYDSVNVAIDELGGGDEGGGDPIAWTPERYARVIRLKEEALNAARSDDGVDLVWFLDGDAFVADPATLKHLLERGHPISAPLLTSTGPYSNFWAGMSPSHYYLRTPEYMPILERKRHKRGCFQVPMVHSSVLVDLDAEGVGGLTFDPAKLEGFGAGVPDDDIIAFALSAKSAGVPMHICNEEKFGYIMTPLEDGEDLADDYGRLSDLRLQVRMLFMFISAFHISTFHILGVTIEHSTPIPFLFQSNVFHKEYILHTSYMVNLDIYFFGISIFQTTTLLKCEKVCHIFLKA